jgi:predicted unusual protein kinase regulating ubiquinone biosynthesis (AarF/ABC1/UbiB family)
MGTLALHSATAASPDRRRAVVARLAAVGAPPKIRRTPPPEGRLGSDEYPLGRLRDALADLGPAFAGFGRYLSSRIDLMPRRDSVELANIPNRGVAMTPSAVEACVAHELGTPLERRFFGFSREPHDVTLWTERHHAWLAPGVPALVVLVRPDAAAWLQTDLPLLPLLQPWFNVPPTAFLAAVDDYAATLRRRLDQTYQAASLALLAGDTASYQSGFGAPLCYRDHCAPGVLTLERPSGVTLGDLMVDDLEPVTTPAIGQDYARRLASAWMRQALSGRVVPFDFGPRDIMVDGDRLVLIGAAFEPHTSAERARFLSYLNAIAADDPDAAAAWILDASASDGTDRHAEDLRRRLRQAVPFRDGEWSGDDRIAEQLLVQWRVAREAGWPLTAHHLHVYRGLHAAATLAGYLAPHDDAVLGALQNERLQMGLVEARRMMDPSTVTATLDRVLQEMAHLPQRLDDVLTLASEGRLRVKLHVPDADGTRYVRNRTTQLVASLVGLAALASIVRQFAPELGAGFERVGAIALLLFGGWLLIVAARM